MMRSLVAALVVSLGLALFACDGSTGLTVEVAGPDAGVEAARVVGVDAGDACASMISLAHLPGDYCSFSVPVAYDGHRVDLYVSGQHQAGAAYDVTNNTLTITSAYVCTNRERDGEVVLSASILIDCISPPSSLL